MFGRKRIAELESELSFVNGCVDYRDRWLKERDAELIAMKSAIEVVNKMHEDAAVKIAERDAALQAAQSTLIFQNETNATIDTRCTKLEHANRSMRGMLRSMRERDANRTELIKDLEISVNWNHQERKQLSSAVAELTQAVTATTSQAEHARGLFESVAETCKQLERKITLLVKSHRKIAPNVKKLRDGDVVIDLINHGS